MATQRERDAALGLLLKMLADVYPTWIPGDMSKTDYRDTLLAARAVAEKLRASAEGDPSSDAAG